MKTSLSNLLFSLTYGRAWVPRATQIALRQWVSNRIRARSTDTWPILESAGTPPAGWAGWPNGKAFALTLTHDVDTRRGLDRCRALMDMEERLGFRSAFYFVPRGRYEVPDALLAEMRARGFEVGVHGLYHDWWMFLIRSVFEKRLPELQAVLRQWGACGFRAPSMVSNLDWVRELGVAYDASTFDTDPFEPFPQGAGTIFPFWVDGANGFPGYVELPYTLAQDFTLFVLLRAAGIEVWQQKFDWIASRGGLAMFDVHPDYVACGTTNRSVDEYPLEHVEAMLTHIRTRHDGAYWHALPREVAAFWRERQESLPPSSSTVAPRPSTGPRVRHGRPARAPTIWIDLDNTPHVPFFKPIVAELRRRGYEVLVTARDAFQVSDLARRMAVDCLQIGRHYGGNRILKLYGLCYRALQLGPTVRRRKPVLAISHGSRSQIILANLLGIPTVLIEDYEHAQFPPLMRPTWRIIPDVIPDAEIDCPPERLFRYAGIKEDVYVPLFTPDPHTLAEIGLNGGGDAIVATVRPPATEAHYHNPESEVLFIDAMNGLCADPAVRIVLLPRNKRQEREVRDRWPQWFADGKTVVPAAAVDGLSLLWHSDLVISGGGTMNREAAALGVPVYSIFRGKLGAVDQQLEKEGRLTIIRSRDEIARKMCIARRSRSAAHTTGESRLLLELVDDFERILERTTQGPCR